MSNGLLKEIKLAFQEKKWGNLALYFLFFVVPPILTHYANQNNISQSQNISIDNIQESKMIPEQTSASNSLEASPEQRVNGIDRDSFVFHEEDWLMNKKYFKKEKDADGEETGFYCAKERTGYEIIDVFYNEKMYLGDSVSAQFSLKREDAEDLAGEEPKIVLSFGRKSGDDDVYYRFFIPDKDRQYIGFENPIDSPKQYRLSPLPSEFKYEVGKEASLKFSVESFHANDAVFSCEFSYLDYEDGFDGAKELITRKTNHEFMSMFPWPNPKDNDVGQDFGIGVYPGTCFKIILFHLERRNTSINT